MVTGISNTGLIMGLQGKTIKGDDTIEARGSSLCSEGHTSWSLGSGWYDVQSDKQNGWRIDDAAATQTL
jgi:hypothetical protein